MMMKMMDDDDGDDGDGDGNGDGDGDDRARRMKRFMWNIKVRFLQRDPGSHIDESFWVLWSRAR